MARRQEASLQEDFSIKHQRPGLLRHPAPRLSRMVSRRGGLSLRRGRARRLGLVRSRLVDRRGRVGTSLLVRSPAIRMDKRSVRRGILSRGLRLVRNPAISLAKGRGRGLA